MSSSVSGRKRFRPPGTERPTDRPNRPDGPSPAPDEAAAPLWATAADRAAVAALLGCAALSILLVDPRGDFPLNDDWNFALATWRFADTGEFVFSRFTGMSLKLQVLWGALWTVVFGKSFEVLRASSLLLGAMTALLIYALLGRVGTVRPVRILASLALFFQPLFFHHTFTYMTHIPYVFVSLVSLYFFFRGIREERTAYFVAGCVVALAACFIRQTGVVSLVAGLAAVALGPKDLRHRARFLLIGSGTLGAFALLYLFTEAFTGYPGQISVHLTLFEGGAADVARNVALTSIRWTSVTLQYGWLLFLPLTLPLVGGMRRFGRVEWLAFLVVLFPIIWMTNEMVIMHQAIPYHWGSNVLRNFAFGPLTLRDTLVFQFPFPRHLPYPPLILMTYVASAGGAFLLVLIGGALFRRRFDGSPRGILIRLVSAHALAATAVLGISSLYFDRYVLDALWTVPLLLAVLCPWTRARMAVATGLLLVMALTSILGTGEYLAWNRARWDAFRDFRSQGIPIEEIDGGYEINQYLIGGWHGGSEMGKKGMAVIDDRFIITFRPLPGYEVMAQYPYETPLGWPRGTIYGLRRTTGFVPSVR